MTTTTDAGARIVIVGAGQAGGECAAQLRAGGHRGPVTLIGDEGQPPYHRPLVSKAYCAGTVDAAGVLLRPAGFYEANAIDLRTGSRATAIARDTQHVELADGTEIPYDRLVLATGGRPRRLSVPELDAAPNALYVRTIDDVDALKTHLRPGARLAVVGGGYLGLEIAASAREFGADVVLVEAGVRLLGRVTSPVVSGFYLALHRAHGVRVHVGTQVDRFVLGAGDLITAITLGGRHIPVDAVVVATGMRVNDELAVAAGLAVEDGIIVDESCRTVDSRILAIGDCTRHPDLVYGGSRRLESAPNAAEQARIAAKTLLGQPESYRSVPWFWSDQYGVKLQMVGLGEGHDDLAVRGEAVVGGSFAVFYLRAGRVQAAEVIGSARDFAMARKLVTARAAVPPQELADAGRPLKDIARDAA